MAFVSKTGLKLLLDQVGLTYRVIAEDNLMIITDQEGSEDPADRIWAELRALHRDLHAVQDAVDDLSDYLGGEGGEGARVRKPTIIEEMPENTGGKPGIGPEKPGRGGEKPEGAGAPAPGSRRCRRAFHWRARGAVFDPGRATAIIAMQIPEFPITDSSQFKVPDSREENAARARPDRARRDAATDRRRRACASALPHQAKSPGAAGSVSPRRRSGLRWPRPS